MPRLNPDGYFLPYQTAYLRDRRRLKIWEKSRRVGATYVQAFEDVRDAARARGAVDVWFSSADESAAREYIRYATQWAKVLDIVARPLGEVALEQDGTKAFSVEFANGHRINALSSNPKAFRSKGGKLVLDEFAFHERPDELWKAALPLITWGYDARVLSTYNGKGNRYYRMVSEAKAGASKWALHTVTIEDAVAQGLADLVLGRKLSGPERRQWLADLEESVGDSDAWRQEYLCLPVDEATAWLPWELIGSVEHEETTPGDYGGGICYLGGDIGRKRDLTVFWVLEPVGDVLWTREVVRLDRCPYEEQEATLDRLIRDYRVVRACIDETGLGSQFVERASRRHGSRVEGVGFTAPVKQDLAGELKRRMEGRTVRIPGDRAIRESLHSVRRMMTTAGNPRFDADRTEAGHADEFWALALGCHAAQSNRGPISGTSISRPRVSGGAWGIQSGQQVNSFAARRRS